MLNKRKQIHIFIQCLWELLWFYFITVPVPLRSDGSGSATLIHIHAPFMQRGGSMTCTRPTVSWRRRIRRPWRGIPGSRWTAVSSRRAMKQRGAYCATPVNRYLYWILEYLVSVLRIQIRIRIHRIHMFLGLLDPDPDPLVRGMDPDPSIVKQI